MPQKLNCVKEEEKEDGWVLPSGGGGGKRRQEKQAFRNLMEKYLVISAFLLFPFSRSDSL